MRYLTLGLLLFCSCASVQAVRVGSNGERVEVSYRRFLTNYNAEVEDKENKIRLKIGTQTDTDKLGDILQVLAGAGILGVASGGVVP